MDINTNSDPNYKCLWLHIELVFSLASVWLLWSSLSSHCLCWAGTFPLKKMLDSSTCSVFLFGLVDLEVKYDKQSGIHTNMNLQVHYVMICANKDTVPVFWDKAKCAIQVGCWRWCERDTSGCGGGCARPAFDELFWSRRCTRLCFSCKDKVKLYWSSSGKWLSDSYK